MSKERPIIFSTSMVIAFLEGYKRETRRIIRPSLIKRFDLPGGGDWDIKRLIDLCPYGRLGDHLWVKEAWCEVPSDIFGTAYGFKAGAICKNLYKWQSPLFMPRSVSRITLEITQIKAERLWDITDSDAIDEGCLGQVAGDVWAIGYSPREEYQLLWDSINGKRRGASWADNPWIWAIRFKRVDD